MKVTPMNHPSSTNDSSSSIIIGSNGKVSVLSRLSNTKQSEEPLLEGKKFLTGRGACIDFICSIKALVICFVICSLFITCGVIWVILMILSSSQVEITMGIVSIVVWITFIVSAILFSILASLGVYSMVNKPINDLTRQLFTMKTFRFETVKKLKSILYEFIPLFTVFFDLNTLMMDIRPFIPESITRQADEDELELEQERIEEERREMQMRALRKTINQTPKPIKIPIVTKVIAVKKSNSSSNINTSSINSINVTVNSTLATNTTANSTSGVAAGSLTLAIPAINVNGGTTPQAQTHQQQSATSVTTKDHESGGVGGGPTLRPDSSVHKLRKAVSKVGAVVALSKKSKGATGTTSEQHTHPQPQQQEKQQHHHHHDTVSDYGSVITARDANFALLGGGGFAPQMSTNRGLGLTSHITTIIIIQFRNFDGRSYPNSGDLLSVFTLLFQKVQSTSRQYRGRCSIITPKVLMISFEVGKNVERNALMCALQLEKQMQSVNSQLTEQVNLPSIEFGIGVSRSECLVGNIGTAAVRFAALIGACSSNALRLAALCAYFGTSILTDESLTLALQIGFITRAVHFMQRKSILDGEKLSLDEEGEDKQTIYQLLGESKVTDDEWFYEIQQQEQNNKYREFDQAFELLRGDVNMNLLSEICEVFGNYSNKNPDDKVVSLLHAQLSDYLKLDATEVEQAVRSFSLEKTTIPLHTDPSFIL